MVEANPSSGVQTIPNHLMRMRSLLREGTENPTNLFIEPGAGYRMAEGETPEQEKQRPSD